MNFMNNFQILPWQIPQLNLDYTKLQEAAVAEVEASKKEKLRQDVIAAAAVGVLALIIWKAW